MNRIVFLSGGVGSWMTGRRVAAEHGTAGMLLVFADTLTEDADTYRFLEQAAADIGAPLERLVDGRDVWDVFRDVRMIGNTRADPCSRLLKRRPAHAFIRERFDPDDAVLYLGIDWSETHRRDAIAAAWDPYQVRFPLTERPYLTKAQLVRAARDAGLQPPRLYELGFPHANCGGFCVKAGQAQFVRLLQEFPERYARHEQKEQELRRELGDVAILRDRRDTGDGGATKPLTLRALRERVEAGGQVDMFDWGACGCFVAEEEADDE